MKHFVIYVPGLGDKRMYAGVQKAALTTWRTVDLQPFYFACNWADTTEPYTTKLQRLIDCIDAAHAKGYTVSLVAASAGSSLALTAFSQRSAAVHAVISICGKLNNPQTVDAALLSVNPAFKESMLTYQRAEPTLTAANRNKILIVQASRDSYVPARDGEVTGAHTHRMHTAGHTFSIFMALTFFRRIIIRFITQDA